MRNNYTNGFTLIEVLVSITLLVTIIFWPISIIAENLIVTAVTERTVKAHLLAQSAIEYVRAERDGFILSPGQVDWIASLREPGSDPDPDWRACIVNADESNRTQYKYCVPQCGDDGPNNLLACGRRNVEAVDEEGNLVRDDDGNIVMTENTNFVDGVSTTNLTRTGDSNTCDGTPAEDNGELTATLQIKLPKEDAEVQYAQVISCVSWKEPNNPDPRKIEFREAFYGWIVKES